MSALLLLLLLSLSAVGLSLALRCPAEKSFPLAALGLTAAGYLLALTGLLSLISWLLWGFAAFGGVMIVRTLVLKQSQHLRTALCCTSLFLLAALVLWWLCRGRALTDWDDFSHWGSALKLTFTTETLYTSSAFPGGFKSYPPATVLWQTLLMKAASPVYREDLALFAHGLFPLLLLLYPLQAIAARRPGSKALCYALLLGFTLALYPRGIYMLGVDLLLGVLAGTLLLAVFLPDPHWTDQLFLWLGCFTLCLVKSSGFGLALMISLCALLFHCFYKLHSKNWLHQLKLSLGMIAACLIAKGSWALHLRQMGASSRWTSQESLGTALLQLFTGQAPAYRKALPGQFFSSLFHDVNYGTVIHFSFAGWLLAFLVLGVLAWCLWSRADRSRVLWGFGAVFGCCVLYLISLLFTYLFLFHEAEATALASISRYLSTIIECLMIFALGFSAVAAAQNAKVLIRLIPALLLAASLTLVSGPQYLWDFLLHAPVYAAQTNHDAYLYRRAAQRIRSLGESDPKLYLITANDAGITQLRVQYELLPSHIPDAPTILMTEPSSDPWVKQCTWQQWRQELLDHYDYVYIYCPEDQFVREFLPVFIDESQAIVDRMFRVVHTGEDAVLETMPEITMDPQPDVSLF